MKFIRFEGNITTESIMSLIEKITEDCFVYFDSEGGNTDGANMFIHFME